MQARFRSRLEQLGGTAPMAIDPRGPRFSALITTVVLAVVLVTGSLADADKEVDA